MRKFGIVEKFESEILNDHIDNDPLFLRKFFLFLLLGIIVIIAFVIGMPIMFILYLINVIYAYTIQNRIEKYKNKTRFLKIKVLLSEYQKELDNAPSLVLRHKYNSNILDNIHLNYYNFLYNFLKYDNSYYSTY